VLSEPAEVEYKCTDVYDPGGEVSLLWNDPGVGIRWPITEPLLSAKDAAGSTLDQLAGTDKLSRFAP
jgi:dTDP-4-dehydrorhamnose 3,5-epimerase